jgi:hypothetical protein
MDRKKEEELELCCALLDDLATYFSACGIPVEEGGFRKQPHLVYDALRDLKKLGAEETHNDLSEFVKKLRKEVDNMTLESESRMIFETFVDGVEKYLQAPADNLVNALHQCSSSLAMKNEVILKYHKETIALREKLGMTIHLLTSMATAAKQYDQESFPDGELVLYDVRFIRRADKLLKQLLGVPVQVNERIMTTHELAWKLLS